MAMRDWQDDWKIPVITKDMPKGKEVEARSSKTPVGDNISPQNPTQQGKPSQNPIQRKKGSAPRKDAQSGKKDTTPTQEEKVSGDIMTQETPLKDTP